MSQRSFPPGPPSPPIDLVAVAVGGWQVLLAWAEGEAGALGFRVERTAGNDPSGPFLKIGDVGPHVTAFRDGSVKPGPSYSYRVHAWDASGDSLFSNVAEVVSPPAGTDPQAE
jgi:hypothetical protein